MTPRNIRQTEMAERVQEMLYMACEWQKSIIEKVGDESKYKGIAKEIFMARYRIDYKVGYYASQRYFKDFLVCGMFKRSEDSGLREMRFKVHEDWYDEWLEKQEQKAKD